MASVTSMAASGCKISSPTSQPSNSMPSGAVKPHSGRVRTLPAATVRPSIVPAAFSSPGAKAIVTGLPMTASPSALRPIISLSESLKKLSTLPLPGSPLVTTPSYAVTPIRALALNAPPMRILPFLTRYTLQVVLPVTRAPPETVNAPSSVTRTPLGFPVTVPPDMWKLPYTSTPGRGSE